MTIKERMGSSHQRSYIRRRNYLFIAEHIRPIVVGVVTARYIQVVSATPSTCNDELLDNACDLNHEPVEIVTQHYSFEDGGVAKHATEIAIEVNDFSFSTRQPETAMEHTIQPTAHISVPSTLIVNPPTSSPALSPSAFEVLQWNYDLSNDRASDELTLVLVMLTFVLCGISLLLYGINYVWKRVHERHWLQQAFHQPSPTAQQVQKVIDKGNEAMPSDMHALAQLYCRHLGFIQYTQQLLTATSSLQFDPLELVLHGFPSATIVLPITHQQPLSRRSMTPTEPLTFFRLLAVLESHELTGGHLLTELESYCDRPLPRHWKNSIDVHMWHICTKDRLTLLQTRINEIELVQCTVLKALEQSHFEKRSIPSDKVKALIQVLRTELSNTSTSQQEEKEDAVIIKSFEKLQTQAELVNEIETAMTSTHSTSLISVEGGSSGLMIQQFETFLMRAKQMKMIHVNQVQQAHYLLEDMKRETFVRQNRRVQGDDNIQGLIENLIDLGIDRETATSKAVDILAMRANMHLLTSSLRSIYDKNRAHYVHNMDEKRKRHEEKEQLARETIVQKFRYKQQLLYEKMELARREREQLAEEEQKKQMIAALEARRAQERAYYARVVRNVTKLDGLVILMVMIIVLCDRLTILRIFQPSCTISPSSPTSLSWWFSSWSTWSILSCRIIYGIQLLIVALLVLLGLYFLTLMSILPFGLLIGLYFIRSKWIMMVFRIPIVLILYGFNSLILYGFERTQSDERTGRQWILLHVLFPLISLILSVLVSIVVACDAPQECLQTTMVLTKSTTGTLWNMSIQAYHL